MGLYWLSDILTLLYLLMVHIMEFLQKFRIAFPELSSAPDGRVLYFYELAQNSMSAPVWARLYEEGVLNLTAHMLTMKYGLDGNGTPIVVVQQEVTSKSIGKIAKGMGSKNSDIYAGAGDYASTVYGRRYWELLRMIRPTGRVYGGGYGGLAGMVAR